MILDGCFRNIKFDWLNAAWLHATSLHCEFCGCMLPCLLMLLLMCRISYGRPEDTPGHLYVPKPPALISEILGRCPRYLLHGPSWPLVAYAFKWDVTPWGSSTKRTYNISFPIVPHVFKLVLFQLRVWISFIGVSRGWRFALMGWAGPCQKGWQPNTCDFTCESRKAASLYLSWVCDMMIRSTFLNLLKNQHMLEGKTLVTNLNVYKQISTMIVVLWPCHWFQFTQSYWSSQTTINSAICNHLCYGGLSFEGWVSYDLPVTYRSM